MRKYLFVINPNAGKKIATQLIDAISQNFPENLDHEIIVWEKKKEFGLIGAKIASGVYTHVVAVGGDGTVNEVAAKLVGSNMVLGIIPAGSGNGLARSLGISMKVTEAVKEISEGHHMRIDTGLVNGRPFFCTSGTGFDAHIGEKFANSKKRGLRSYVSITMKELFRYRARTYEILINNETKKRKAFLVTVANAGQYGNDFYIAPAASLNDGHFHLVILKPFGLLSAFGLLGKVLAGRADKSRFIETIVANNIKIVRKEMESIHLDGEPFSEVEELHFELLPSSIQVITGKNYKTQLSA